jgi:signal transduction histidine kinase
LPRPRVAPASPRIRSTPSAITSSTSTASRATTACATSCTRAASLYPSAVDAALAANRPWVLDFRIVHADGNVRWVHERGVKTVDRDGSEWIDEIIFDVTERQAAEQLRVEREMLEASRARIIAAADDARRRIERDLHDGAQQRLVVAALLLRTAENAIEPGSPAAKTLTAARAELDAGLAELRALARGIHPAVLTDRGLGPALQSLVAHCAVPVELHDELGERLAPTVETALYFVVSEALTNVDRYAGASRATVLLAQNDSAVEVEVADDGRGGADPARGSGLRGLQDRLSAIGGTLALDSPPEHGMRHTRQRAAAGLARQPLARPSNTIVLRAVDSAGNVSEPSNAFTLPLDDCR